MPLPAGRRFAVFHTPLTYCTRMAADIGNTYLQYDILNIRQFQIKDLMYSAHLSLRANAHTRHDKQFNKQPNDQGRGSYTKEGRPVMPRAKPEGETQAGNQPMRRGLGRRDYSRLKTAGTRTGITDPFLSIPVHPSFPLPPPPPLAPLPQSPGWPAS